MFIFIQLVRLHGLLFYNFQFCCIEWSHLKYSGAERKMTKPPTPDSLINSRGFESFDNMFLFCNIHVRDSE